MSFINELYVIDERPSINNRKSIFNNNLPGERAKNVQLLDFPKETHEYDSSYLEDYKTFLKMKSAIQKNLELAKNNQITRSSQDAYVEVELLNDEYKHLFDGVSLEHVAKMFVVSEIKFVEGLETEAIEGVKVLVKAHEGVRCDRCWNYTNDVHTTDDGSHLCPRCKEVVGE